MKKLLATIALSAVAACAFGQGTVNIGTGAGGATKFIVTHQGTRIAGTDYMAQLFWANGEVTDQNALSAAGSPVNPRTGGAAGVLPSGEVRFETVTPPGGVVTLQLRGWATVLGNTEQAAYTDWLGNAASDTRVYGRSVLFTMDTGNPLAMPPETPPSIGAAFPGLTLVPVPEPSTIALAILGGMGALVLFRRRK